MTITEATTIADIAAALPASVPVFQRHSIDFCCGGKTPIGEVCRDRGLDLDTLTGEIAASAASRPTPDRDWSLAALGTLIEHIIATYHEPLRRELPRLEAMATKVATVHGPKEAQLVRVAEIMAALSVDLLAHMQEEERVLFPAINALADAGAAQPLATPISALEHDHDRAGALLAELRERTTGYAPPSWACATMRALYAGLAAFEAAMHVHVHLENNVLFPRALGLVEARR